MSFHAKARSREEDTTESTCSFFAPSRLHTKTPAPQNRVSPSRVVTSAKGEPIARSSNPSLLTHDPTGLLGLNVAPRAALSQPNNPIGSVIFDAERRTAFIAVSPLFETRNDHNKLLASTPLGSELVIQDRLTQQSIHRRSIDPQSSIAVRHIQHTRRCCHRRIVVVDQT